MLLALIQLLTPLFNIFFNSWALQVTPVVIVNWLFSQNTALEIFEAVFLMPLAGIAIFMMRRWSYAVFLVAQLWALYSNFNHWREGSSTLSFTGFLLVQGLGVVLVSYFLLPAVRKTYFDPRMRWWESKPRYPLKADAEVEFEEGKCHGTVGQLLNLSEGGAFFAFPEEISMGRLLTLHFAVLGMPFEVKARVVHIREATGGATGYWYGLQFEHTRRSWKTFHDLAQALELIGFEDRIPQDSPWVSLKNWISTLLKTGKGITPSGGSK